MENHKLNRKTFFYRLVQASMKAIRRGPEAVERVYKWGKASIEKQIESMPESEQEYKERMQILEKAYVAFSDSEMADIIIKNNVTDKQFISRYGERILGDNKRKYE